MQAINNKTRLIYFFVYILMSMMICFFNCESPASDDDYIPSTDDGEQTERDTTPPIIKNLAVSFEPYNPNTGRAGSFVFTGHLENKVFLEFGPSGTGGTGKFLPTFEYLVAKDTDILAIADGIIVHLGFQDETQDYEIWIKPSENSVWTINQDHIINPTVNLGDTILVGQILGKTGNLSPGPDGTFNTLLGRTEIQIVDESRSYCPFLYFDSTLIEEYRQKVTRLMQDWESFKGDITLYDEDTMVEVGCMAEYYDE